AIASRPSATSSASTPNANARVLSRDDRALASALAIAARWAASMWSTDSRGLMTRASPAPGGSAATAPPPPCATVGSAFAGGGTGGAGGAGGAIAGATDSSARGAVSAAGFAGGCERGAVLVAAVGGGSSVVAVDDAGRVDDTIAPTPAPTPIARPPRIM